MNLNQLERESALWKRVSDELTGRLQVLREKNDGALDAVETATIRGSIRMVKEILSWSALQTKIE